MTASYYYADSDAQPVGPLSLDEIRRFAAAGVIPPDVLVCEADGEEWRPLTAFAGPPRNAPPRKGPPPMARPVSAVADPGQATRRLGTHFNHAVFAVVIAFVFNLTAIGAPGSNGGTGSDSTLPLFAGLTSLWALAAEVILVFKLCCILPPHLLFTTPGKATGFLFIPGFHLYWAFQLFPGLATAAIRWQEQEAPSSHAPTWLIHLGYAVAVMLGLVSVFVLLEATGVIPVSPQGQIVYLIDYSLRFSFYSMLVGQLQRVVCPGSKPRHVSFMLSDTGNTPKPLVWGFNVLLPVVSGIILIIAVIAKLLGIVD